MKQVYSGLADLLDGYQFIVAELYTIRLSNGDVLRWCAGDGEIRYIDYQAEEWVTHYPMPLERDDITQQTGIEVNECKVTLFCNTNAMFGSLTAQHFARIGGFDNARVKIELAIMPVYGDVQNGLIHLFEGNVSDVVIELSKVELTVSSDTILLDAKVPTTVYQPSCVHTLYDGGCGLIDDNFGAFGTTVAGASASQIWFNSAAANGYFNLGYLTFTSGTNVGITRTVKDFYQYSTAVATVNYEFPFNPAVGDTFIIVPGCDKLRATCRTKFNNEVHFLGWEYMPVPEASL